MANVNAITCPVCKAAPVDAIGVNYYGHVMVNGSTGRATACSLDGRSAWKSRPPACMHPDRCNGASCREEIACNQ